MVSKTRVEGKKGEAVGCNYLQNKGFSLITMNYTCQYGEVDIIAEKGDEIIFVEVKTRKRDLSAAFSSVSVRKRIRLIRSAVHFLQNNPEFEGHCMRFDVIGLIYNNHTGLYKISHLEDAFRVEELEDFL